MRLLPGINPHIYRSVVEGFRGDRDRPGSRGEREAGASLNVGPGFLRFGPNVGPGDGTACGTYIDDQHSLRRLLEHQQKQSHCEGEKIQRGNPMGYFERFIKQILPIRVSAKSAT